MRRHLDLVHSAALRQVRSPQLAEEVSQSVFLKLASHASKLAPKTIVTAWLYQVTRREAIDVVRREARRQLREQIATEMNAMNATDDDWKHIEPLLDEAVHALDETDRAAVLLRYFENKSLREVGQTMGTSENAAQKRLSRAVERLREFFGKRGITVGVSGLVVLISGNAVQAAPVGMAAAVSTAAVLAGKSLAASATVSTTSATATKAIAVTTLQKAILGATLAVAVGTGIYHAQQNSKLRERVQPADLFKKFLSDPPIISDLYLVEKNIEHKQMFFHHLKCQQGAFIIATHFEPNLDDDGISGLLSDTHDLNKFGYVISEFGDTLWNRSGNGLTTWTNRDIPSELSNEVQFAYAYARGTSLPTIADFGCYLMPFAGVKWDGDSFSCTNRARGIWLRGDLQRDEAGRAALLKVVYGQLEGQKEKPFGSGLNFYKYYYDQPLSLPYIPSRIEEFVTDPTDPPRRVFIVYSVKTSSHPLPKEEFAIGVNDFTNLDLAAYEAKGSIVMADLNSGKVSSRTDDIAKSMPPQPARHRDYLYLSLSILVAAVIYLGWMNRRSRRP